MLSTLRAVVEGERIHWQEAVDGVLPAGHPVEVLVTVLESGPGDLSVEERARRRIAAVRNLAALDAFSGIEDPVEWQRGNREDRQLPGRDS